MGMYRRGLIVVEARQLIGSAADTMDVINWIRNVGEYPWLLGNALFPETLVPEGSDDVGGKGVYIDPDSGVLVIHDLEKDKKATYADWIVLNSDKKFEVWSTVAFMTTYDAC